MHFTLQEKQVFAYSGQKVDPLDLLSRITSAVGDLSKLVQMASSNLIGADPLQVRMALGAQEKLSNAIRGVFGFQDFDRKSGEGATEAEVFDAWDRFCAYLAERKDTCRQTADFAAAYGRLPEPLTYNDYVGLKLNTDRVHWRMALMVAHGVAAAMGSSELPVAMMDPVAQSDKEAEDMAFEANAQRQFQKARQELAGR